MRLKILQLCSARGFGGGERHVFDLCHELSQRGHEVHLAHRPNAEIAARLASVPALHLHALPLRHALDVLSARDLARLAHDFSADLLHAHLGRDYPLAALATHRARPARLVLTRHVMFPLNPLHRLTCFRAAGVIAVSAAVQRQLLAQKLTAPEKLTVIHNGLDTTRFVPQDRTAARALWRDAWQLNDDSNRFWVGMMATLGPLKGADDFLHTAALIAQKRSDIAFIIAGAGRAADRQRLAQIIDSKGLTGCVRLVGEIADTASFYAALDIFVSASHSEAFGLTIAEAMACGRAVIATSTDGAREIVRHDATGCLVPIAQPVALASVIQELLTADATRRDNLARAAHADVTARFSLKGMVDRTERLYQKLVLSPDGRR